MIALDTNVVIAAINLRPARIRARLDAEIVGGATVGIPALVLFEMRYGVAKSDRRARADTALRAFLELDVTLWAFEAEGAAHAGDIRADLEQRGTPIGHYDYLIAAQARRRGAVLVTANRCEFKRVAGLTVDDWFA